MFRPEDGRALHAIDVAVRLHFQPPKDYARYAEAGLDLLAEAREWVAEEVVDTISGDDVAFLAAMAADARLDRRKAS